MSLARLARSSAVRVAPLRVAGARAASSTDEFLVPKSPISTYKYQKSLPRLPIPKLDESLDKYLLAVKPLVSEAEFAKTSAIVEDFRRGDGPILQKELEANDAANKHTSYISEPWYDMYLADRQPLPINYNPQISMVADSRPEKNVPAARGAALVSSAIRFYNSLRAEVLVPDVFHTKPTTKEPWFPQMMRFVPDALAYYPTYFAGGYALDMSQYKRLFGTARIPARGKDLLEGFSSSTHIVVLHKNNFYKVELKRSDGKWASEAEIYGILQDIVDSKDAPAAHAVGVLSTDERDRWAAARAALLPGNETSVHAVDSALFVLALDTKVGTSLADTSRQFLLGDGRNRWFDKSFTLIVDGEGKTAINFEHSWGDGVAIVRFLDEVFADMQRFPVVRPARSDQVRRAELLPWKVSAQTAASIKTAAERFDADSAAMDLEVFTTDVMSRAGIKAAKLSPDGFMQMSFQLAHYLLNGTTATTYESASTAGFKHGRTECIRTASLESVEFTKAFAAASTSRADRERALRAAIDRHSKTTAQAMMGKGFDRHLFGLRFTAKRIGKPVPAIFQDKAYQVINHNVLSTSTLSSPSIELGGFGPVVRDGYGIGYGMDESRLRFNITSYLGAKPFIEALDKALKLMRDAVNTK